MEPFSEQEKRQLLIEIIRNSQIDNRSLFRIIGVSSIAPDWFNLALPNGRSVAECQATLMCMRNEAEAGMKRKAPSEEPNSESSNGVQVPGSQEPQMQPPPTTGTRPQMNMPYQTTTPTNPQQHQHQIGPPPKKKGRPAYAGRNVISQRPFNPRPLAPMPPQQALRNAQSSFRPIAPAPQLHQGAIIALTPAAVRSLHEGFQHELTTEQQGRMRLQSSQDSAAVEVRARQSVEQQRDTSIQAPDQQPSRPRSNSEAVPGTFKQEPTEQDRSRSAGVLEMTNETSATENDSSDQTQQKANGSPKESSKGLRRSQRKA